MTTHRLDTEALHLALYARMHTDKLSAREVAALTGVSASTLTRIKHGQRPDADGLVTLLVWLERGIEDFTMLNAHATAPTRHAPLTDDPCGSDQ